MDVIKEGFDLSKARGGTLGKGIYFADSAKKSHSYTGVRREPGRGILKNRESRLAQDQTRHILQCQVALGHTEVLKGSHCAKMGIKAGFDRYKVTVLNYTSTFTITVVYFSITFDRERMHREYLVADSSQVYPQFLISYKVGRGYKL